MESAGAAIHRNKEDGTDLICPYGLNQIAAVLQLYGYPSSGKSSFLLDIVSRATRGDQLPNGGHLDKPVSAVYQCTEAGRPSITKKMLVNSGADLDRVSFIKGSFLTINDPRIQRAVRESDSKILIIDPIQNFLENDMSNAQTVRRELSAISSFATETGCAVILIGHFTKKETAEAQYQGMGSADIAAIARSIIHVKRISKGSPLRYIQHVKCNIAPEGENYSFELTDLGKVSWIGLMNDDDIEQLEEESKRDRSLKLTEAMEALSDILKTADLDAVDVMTQMKAKGFSDITVRRAKRGLDIQSIRQSDKCWVWRLPSALTKPPVN